MMKILFLGVFDKSSTNYSQAEAFERNGCEVIRCHFRTYLLQSVDFMCKQIVDMLHYHKPDFVFFSKCNEVPKSVVSICNSKCNTILWYMDPMNIQYSTALQEKIQYCKHIFIALEAPYKETLKTRPDTHFLQEGFDPLIDKPVETEYQYDVSFIGNLRNSRINYTRQVPFTVISDAYSSKHALRVSQSKINLNFTEGGTSDRTYKVLAAGGFLLTQPWDNMERDFIIGKDLDIFTSPVELTEKIDYYINNENERLEIAKHGNNTVQKFNRTNWAKKILEVVT